MPDAASVRARARHRPDRSGRGDRRRTAAGEESRAVPRWRARVLPQIAERASSSSSATARAASRSSNSPPSWASTRSVRFLGTRNDVPRLLAASDVFALTSHNEANPVSILEAMSVGKPVVATNVGSIQRSGRSTAQTGYLVPPGDATALADRLICAARRSAPRRGNGRPRRAKSVVEQLVARRDGPRLRAADRVDLLPQSGRPLPASASSSTN